MNSLVCSSLQQNNLPATYFFSRSAKKLYSARNTECFQNIGQRQECRKTSCCNEVVATGMADIWQGIVLRVEIYETALGAT